MLVGFLTPMQGAINSQLSRFMHHPLQASFISFLGGLVSLSIIIILLGIAFPGLPTFKTIPWYLYLGGFIGAGFVSTMLILIPRIGALNMLGAAIAGQLIMSVIIDHYGLFGVPQHSMNYYRAGGILLLMGGLLLMRK